MDKKQTYIMIGSIIAVTIFTTAIAIWLLLFND